MCADDNHKVATSSIGPTGTNQGDRHMERPKFKSSTKRNCKSERGKRTTVSRRVNYHEKQKQTGSTANLNERDITYIEKSR